MKMTNNKHKPFTVILSRSYDITEEDLKDFIQSDYFEEIVQNKSLPKKDLAILCAYSRLEGELDCGLISGTQDDFSAKII